MFFRHFRPTYFDRSRLELVPHRKGGISFLFIPTEEQGKYDYWVSFCPPDIPFSATTALSKLRAAFKSNTVPWGTFEKVDDEPILETALAHLVRENNALSSEIPQNVFAMMVKHFSAKALKEAAIAAANNSSSQYENTI